MNSFSVLLLSFFLFLHRSQSHHPHLDNSTDEEALLNFKSKIKRDPNGVLHSWNPNSSFCKWHGVLCNPIKLRVIALKLGDSSLTGTISSHLTNLSFLQFLDLHNNTFSGDIPPYLHRLFRLKFLDLSFNNLHGLLPSSLSLCFNLRVVNFSHNYFHGKIPSEIAQLSKLYSLNFGNNKLSGEIPSSFANLSSLTVLRLTSNYIGGSLPPELGRLHNLQSLLLGINNITGEFPTQLLNISSLVKLNIAINEISGSLPSELFSSFPSLASARMAGNTFSGFIPSSISNASELEELDLSGNRFSGRIPLFWKLGKIQYLNLEENNLTCENGDGGLDFITSLTNSTFLQTLSVSRNQLMGQLPSSIGNLSNQLSRLYMGDNLFEGALPEQIGNLENLAMIDLELNYFTDKIPSSLGNLRNLESLLLSNNVLSGSMPEALANLTFIFIIGLEENNLSGELPSILSNFRRLNYLNLRGNGFTGNIPNDLLTLKSLDYLDVSFNKLCGSLPYEIGNLIMLRYLDLSDNELSGPIPSVIGDCTNLEALFLSNNSFQGPIPITLTNLRGIEYIDLSFNELTGKIPPLGSLPNLQSLNLSSNNLQGEVPKNGVFLNASAVLLSHNSELCGGIPQLGLPNCLPFRKSNTKRTIGIVFGAIFVGVSVTIIALFFYVRNREKQPGPQEAAVISFDEQHRTYSFYELKAATGNFSEENLIGRGSFGAVYRGEMRDGGLVAIKVLDMDQNGAVKSFVAECEAFRNIRHRNLVKIVSSCSGMDFKALVLQYMENGNLESWIHGNRGDEENRSGLSLKQRIDIAVDVASAMEYLHHGCEAPIVHCDLKPSNVLLDENMVAHVTDFGLARMLRNQNDLSNHQENSNSTIGLKGSIGYIAPGNSPFINFEFKCATLLSCFTCFRWFSFSFF